MGVLNIVLLVFFVIVAILLVLMVLIQNEEGDSLGGIFAGGSSSAFGSRSGNVLTRTTSILGGLFLVLSLSLALINRTPGDSGVEAVGRQLSTDGTGSNWVDEELNPPASTAPVDVFSESSAVEQTEPAGEQAEPEVPQVSE
jgi:preprotein translocase subunit SecG